MWLNSRTAEEFYHEEHMRIIINNLIHKLLNISYMASKKICCRMFR